MEPTVGEQRSPGPVTAASPAPQLPDGPLSGLRVVEFGQLLAGPYVGTLLGDFGADVVKIEPPPRGDAMRDWAGSGTTGTRCGGRSWRATSGR